MYKKERTFNKSTFHEQIHKKKKKYSEKLILSIFQSIFQDTLHELIGSFVYKAMELEPHAANLKRATLEFKLWDPPERKNE